MENAILEKRMERCEDDIKALSKEMANNSTSMDFVKDIVEKFGKTQDETVKTLIKIQGGIDNLNSKQENFDKKLSEIEGKVDKNENLNTIDLREIQKNTAKSVFEKILIILSPLALLAFVLYMLFGK